MKAMQKEAKDQMQNGNFSFIKRSDVPKGSIVLLLHLKFVSKVLGHKLVHISIT